MISLLLTDSNNINEKLNNKRSSLKNINVILLLESFVFDLVSFIIVKNLQPFGPAVFGQFTFCSGSLGLKFSLLLLHPSSSSRSFSFSHFRPRYLTTTRPFHSQPLTYCAPCLPRILPLDTTMPFPILPASFRPSDSISSMCLQSTRIYVCACVCIHSCTLRYKLQRSSPLDIGQ